MAVLTDAALFAVDPAVRPPLTAGIVAAAIMIANEDPNIAMHAERVALAHDVLANPAVAQDRFAWAVSTNATVVGKWAAGDLDGAVGDFAYVIATVWDALAR